VKAGLCDEAEDWPWSSARQRSFPMIDHEQTKS
jgi:hypothetical protein